MIEAMWSVRFVTNQNIGGNGVLVIENGKIFGGDSSYTYIGNFEIHDGRIKSNIKVSKYADTVGIISVVGSDNYVLALSGKIDRDEMILSGNPSSNPQIDVVVKLTRIAELD
jgi:hypothetical protein